MAQGARWIEASRVLTIMDSDSGLELLQIPIGALAMGWPRLSTDHSRLAVATERQIAVFDVGPMPEFELPDDRLAPESRTGPPSN